MLSPLLAGAPARDSVRWSAWLLVLAALFGDRAAAAQNAVAVTVTPRGQTWSVGDRGGQPCDPSCTLFLPPDTYRVRMNGLEKTLPIQVPTELTYDPGSPRLRTVAGWTAVGGVGTGAALLGFGAYGWLESCGRPYGCSTPLPISRPAAEALVFGAAGLISVSVVGALVFAVSGDAIQVRELATAPDPPRRRSFDVMVAPASHGATLGFGATF